MSVFLTKATIVTKSQPCTLKDSQSLTVADPDNSVSELLQNLRVQNLNPVLPIYDPLIYINDWSYPGVEHFNDSVTHLTLHNIRSAGMYCHEHCYHYHYERFKKEKILENVNIAYVCIIMVVDGASLLFSYTY